MAGSSLLALLDNIATVLDDIALDLSRNSWRIMGVKFAGFW